MTKRLSPEDRKRKFNASGRDCSFIDHDEALILNALAAKATLRMARNSSLDYQEKQDVKQEVCFALLWRLSDPDPDEGRKLEIGNARELRSAAYGYAALIVGQAVAAKLNPEREPWPIEWLAAEPEERKSLGVSPNAWNLSLVESINYPYAFWPRGASERMSIATAEQLAEEFTVDNEPLPDWLVHISQLDPVTVCNFAAYAQQDRPNEHLAELMGVSVRSVERIKCKLRKTLKDFVTEGRTT